MGEDRFRLFFDWDREALNASSECVQCLCLTSSQSPLTKDFSVIIARVNTYANS